METKLQRLDINPTATTSKASGSKVKTPVAESWEEDVTSGDEITPGIMEGKSSIPNAPPPTPSSPRTHFPTWNAIDSDVTGNRGLAADARSRGQLDDVRRPEKSTAVAGRLIAAGLGVKAPKRTEEQRAYDRAAKEKEIRRRNREKEEAARAEQENEKAKSAIWDA